MRSVDHHLAGMLEVHSDLASNVRLHLPKPPILPRRVAHQHSRLKERIHVRHGHLPFGARAVTSREDLSALLGSRICHDLISPLGAIGNGVELLSLAGLDAAPEIALISESVESANARIRFFRVAFGAALEGSHIGQPEIRAILADITKGGRLHIDWTGRADPSRAEAKLAFLLILCLESSLPFGGRITVSDDGGWRLEGRAQRMMTDPALWGLFLGQAGAPELAASNVHFALASDLSRRIGRPIRTTLGEDAITISF